MELIERKTMVTKEGNDLGEAFKSVLQQVDYALENDGKITPDEIATIAMASFGKLTEALKGIKGIVEEGQKAPFALYRGVVDPITEGLEELLDKTGKEDPESVEA